MLRRYLLFEQKNTITMKKEVLAALFLTAAIFASCSKDDDVSSDITIKKDSATLHFGDEFQIEATSELALNYESEDKYHAIVDENGLVTATYIGETNIIVSNKENSKKVKITVLPEYNLYDDPSEYIGKSTSEITSILGEPDSSTSGDIISYKNYSSYAAYIFFDIENDKVKDIMVMVKTTYMTKLINSLKERYFYVGSLNDAYTFVNNVDESKITTMITTALYNSSYIAVMYTPYSSSK